MITFRTTTITFFICLFVMNMISLAWQTFPVLSYIILIIVYLFVSVFFSFYMRTGFHLNAYCKKETNDKIIALTFDDGPDPEITPAILDILKGKTKATFFCIGRKIEGNEEILKRMDAEGHLIGTHSYSHSNWFDLFSSTRMKDEFIRTDQKILEITGKKPLLFRPPYGVINPLLKKALRSFSYHIIGFSNRPWDTMTKNEVKIMSRLVGKLKPGDVVLLHDSIPQSIPVLKGFMKIIEEKGFTVVSLTELFDIQAYA
jgi:peptidoglycan/xylan/chitin deacetylase (PgdA/CDA1 family)